MVDPVSSQLKFQTEMMKMSQIIFYYTKNTLIIIKNINNKFSGAKYRT